MSTVISLLEKMGQDASLRYADKKTVTEQLDPALAAAILAGDQRQLEAMLGAKNKIVCMIYAAEEDEEQDNLTVLAKAV
ncbi:hypothetical protein EIK76_16215 [Rheinheimera mesophila]|uniref:Uncharacterized protein n=1 Tax=Rheinheimera mesophila TaxID=1547515 RepID=A0A3P3QCB6_9GAMM|nr:hypothetical protein [Rheinheimera mesophila]KKL02620.1 hypothetical protein SD53_04070 [Rheinheimera mesophila]RRJ18764.1 hypothetical protein EIK76_16215 [Rheinheimera mesophila]